MIDSRSPGRISENNYYESFTLGQSVDNYHVGGRLSGDVEIKEKGSSLKRKVLCEVELWRDPDGLP